MPNRIIRDGILDSRRVAELSDGGELFYRKLMSLVDDFARYEFDLEILRVKLYPRKLSKVTIEKVVAYLKECCLSPDPLVLIYTTKNRLYLEIQNFKQRARAEVSKFPDPSGCSLVSEYHALTDGGQLAVNNQADARLARIATTNTTTNTTTPEGSAEGNQGIEFQQRKWFDTFWAKYWRRTARDAAWRAFKKHVTTEELFRQAMDAVEAQSEAMLAREDEHRPHASTWINGRRWTDEIGLLPARASPVRDVPPPDTRPLDQIFLR